MFVARDLAEEIQAVNMAHEKQISTCVIYMFNNGKKTKEIKSSP